MIAEYNLGAAPSSPNKEYLYANSSLLATIQGTTTTYHHPDHLSVRLTTDANGNLVGQQANFPFGEAWYSASTTTKWRFTGYERDNESGNDYSTFRFYVNRLGRFSSTDPLAGDISDPQSLNRYAYVLSDPIDFVDPIGLACYWDDGTHDDDPDNGGATKEQCELLGGTWIDPVVTTINVDAQDAQPSSPQPVVPVEVMIIIPAIPFGPYASLGFVFEVAYVSQTKTICGGFGVGGQTPAGARSVSVTPLMHGDSQNASRILRGWSIGVGLQPTPLIGYQVVGNASGILGGPSVGTSGGAATLTVAGCTTVGKK